MTGGMTYTEGLYTEGNGDIHVDACAQSRQITNRDKTTDI